MARILAHQCGYEPLEINASDERTGNQILNKIKSAISSDDHFTIKSMRQQLLEKDGMSAPSAGKPVCLIVDEVDGALGSSFEGANSKGVHQIVEYLKKCIAYEAKSGKKKDTASNDVDDDDDEEMQDEQQEEVKAEKKKKKKDTDVVPLRRPIIFICNDMYARALAPLRELALTIKIEESGRKRLTDRMREICKIEKVAIDDQVIREIAEETNYDARSCINTLQFISASQKETKKRITVDSAVEAAGKFQCFKDTSESVFKVGEDILINKEKYQQSNVKMLN